MRTMRRVGAGVMLVLLASGCMGWRRVQVPTPPATLQVHRVPVRVTLVNRDVYEFQNVVIVTDSLFGTTMDEVTPVRMGIALRNVTRLEERYKDNRRTLLAFAGVVALLLYSGLAGTGLK